MDCEEPRRADLTEEQWAQRVAWVHKVWAADIVDPEWRLTSDCITRARAQGHNAPLTSAFTHPEMYPAFINAVFEKYMECKLLGETP